MIKQANTLDELGFYKEADAIDKVIYATTFNLKKKRKTPEQMLQNLQLSVNSLQNEMSGVNDALDFSDGENKTKVQVMVDNKPVEFTSK